MWKKDYWFSCPSWRIQESEECRWKVLSIFVLGGSLNKQSEDVKMLAKNLEESSKNRTKAENSRLLFSLFHFFVLCIFKSVFRQFHSLLSLLCQVFWCSGLRIKISLLTTLFHFWLSLLFHALYLSTVSCCFK